MGDVLWVLLIGLVVGWLAGLIVKGRGFGIAGDIIVGLIGAVVGRWLFGVLGLAAYGTLGALVMALVGASFLLGLISLIKHA